MRVLASRGDNAEALRVYDELRVRLRDELGVAPSRALIELHQQLLSGEPVASQEDVTEPERPYSAMRTSPRRLPVLTTALIGRSADVRAVTTLLQREDVRLLTLVGSGGVGKTRLAMAVAGLQARPSCWVELAGVARAEDVAAALVRGRLASRRWRARRLTSRCSASSARRPCCWCSTTSSTCSRRRRSSTGSSDTRPAYAYWRQAASHSSWPPNTATWCLHSTCRTQPRCSSRWHHGTTPRLN